MSLFDQRFHLLNNRGSLGLNCTSTGVFLAGVPLLRMTPAGFAPRPAEEIDSLIKAAYGHDARSAELLARLDSIADALNRGDDGRAMIIALHLKLPDLSWVGATRIASVSRALTKYDPSEPRDARGQWTASNESAVDHSAPQNYLRPSTTKPMLVSDHGAANDNRPPITPPVVSYGLMLVCMRNARDPHYQDKMEDCKAAHEKCLGLIELGGKDLRREAWCEWPDGTTAYTRGGMVFPEAIGHPF